MLVPLLILALAPGGSSESDLRPDIFATSLALIGREAANDTLVVGDGTPRERVDVVYEVAAAHFFDAATGAYRFSAAAGFMASDSEDGLLVAGDLDGDGFEDVWVSVHDEEYRAHFLALSGRDGRVLVDAVPPGAERVVGHGVLFRVESETEGAPSAFEVVLSRREQEGTHFQVLGGRLSSASEGKWSLALDDWVLLEGGNAKRANALAYRCDDSDYPTRRLLLRRGEEESVLHLEGYPQTLARVRGADLLFASGMRWDESYVPWYGLEVLELDTLRRVHRLEWSLGEPSIMPRPAALGDWTGDGVGEIAFARTVELGAHPGDLVILDAAEGEILFTVESREERYADLRASWFPPHFGYDVLEAPRAASEPRALWVASCAGWKRGAPGCVQLLEPATGREVLFLARPAEVRFAEPEERMDPDGTGTPR